MLRLLLLFTVVPLTELVLLLMLADYAGWQFTVALVLLTGISGAALARWQGLRCLHRVQQQAVAGQIPADSLMDGVMILVAAVLLVTPGVLTDVVGFALLVPPMRFLIKRAVRRYMEARLRAFRQSADVPSDFDGAPHDRVIDVRATDSDDESE